MILQVIGAGYVAVLALQLTGYVAHRRGVATTPGAATAHHADHLFTKVAQI